MDKKKKKKGKKRKKEEGRENEQRGRERERKGKSCFRFSLRSTEIGSSVFIGVRRKVDPRIMSYMWVLKSWSFFEFHEVGNFPTWIISSLKAI